MYFNLNPADFDIDLNRIFDQVVDLPMASEQWDTDVGTINPILLTRLEQADQLKSIVDEYFLSQGLADKGPSVEVGSGEGLLCHLLDPKYSENIIETENSLVMMSRRLNKERQAIAASAYGLPFENEYAGSIIGMACFDTFIDLESAMREFHNVLKKGGEIHHILDLRPDSIITEQQIKKAGYIPIPMVLMGEHDGYFIISKENYKIFEQMVGKEIAGYVKNISFLQTQPWTDIGKVNLQILERVGGPISGVGGYGIANIEYHQKRIAYHMEKTGFQNIKLVQIEGTPVHIARCTK